MGRTACTEPQCLYKGALYLTFTLLMNACLLQKFNLVLKALLVFIFCLTASYSLLFLYKRKLGDKSLKGVARLQMLPDILQTQGRCVLYMPSSWRGLAAGILCG
jgi:hypothetical protein